MNKYNIVEENLNQVILTRKGSKFVWGKIRCWVLLVCIWLTYDYEIGLQKLKEKESDYFQELDLNYITLVNLKTFCYFFFIYAQNFRYSSIFKFLSFVTLFEQNFNYIFLYNCLKLKLGIREILVNVDELLLRFIELYIFNLKFLFCRKTFFSAFLKKSLILFDKFILKVDLVSFFFLDKYIESYRRIKYNEYLNMNPFIKNKWFRKSFLRFFHVKRRDQAQFFINLREYYNLSLLKKRIIVCFFTANILGYVIQHNPVILYNVALNSFGLDKFKLKKNTKFFKFTMSLLLKQLWMYMGYFFFKIFMRYYRRYWMEEWFYLEFIEIYSNLIRIKFNFMDLSLKLINFFEKDFLKQQILKLNLTNFYILFDLLNYNNLDKSNKIFLTESLNCYKVIEVVFCNYFSEILINMGYTFDELDWTQIVRFFEEIFIESLFNFYYMKNFLTILDYFCWRIINTDINWNIKFFSYIKNSSFDWICFSRYVLVLDYFRKLHPEFYFKGKFLNSRIIILLYVYRDLIFKMVFSSYFLIILYYFLQNNTKLLKNFCIIFNKRIKRDLLNKFS